MKGYLSGPMLGYEQLNYPLFGAWAKDLRERGHEVLSPHEVPAPPDDTENPIAYYMREDIAMVLQAECLWMIPGWMYSRGAKIEATVAMAIGIPLLDVETEKPLPIRRIHEVVDCDHQGWTQGVQGLKAFGLDEVFFGYDECIVCGRYPIYDNKFRIEVIDA